MQQVEKETLSAYAFLFDGSVEGLPDPQLPFFTAAVLSSLSDADPAGTCLAQIRIGLPSLADFAQRVTAVSGSVRSGGHTIAYDMDTYRYVLWDWLDSLSTGWSSIDIEAAQKIFLRHTCECVALSALDAQRRDIIDAALKAVPGYTGAFAIDPGNPLHRGGFFEGLIKAAAAVNGAVHQEISIDGDKDWPLKGAAEFKPNGLIWEDYGWLSFEGPPGLPRTQFSERGAQAAANVGRKQATRIEERVLSAIFQKFVMNDSRKTFEFKAVGENSDILQAIMPEGKFTKYLFDRSSKDGGAKATFLIDVLGIDPEDWRYLAAQFYHGLLLAEPNKVRFKEWETGYGICFDVLMRVRSRTGNKVVVETGWNMNPGASPSLSTAFPGPRSADAVEPGDQPILRPGPRTDADWAQLWGWANAAGIDDGQAAIPTPMYLVDFGPVAEGESGSALVRVPDARTGLARWLLREKIGRTDGRGGTIVFSPLMTQSVDRSATWARTVVKVLRLNGLEAQVELFYS